MKINNHIILDFNKTKQVDTQTIQCDMNSRFVRVSLRHNNSPIDLSDVRVCIMAVKPDGKEIFNDCTVIDAQNGIAEFEITKQMGIVVGEVECQIKLFGKEKLLSSNIFNLSVNKSLYPDSQDSKDQLNTLVNTLGEVQDINNRFNKTNYKIDENYQKVNAQLSECAKKEDVARISSGTPLFVNSILEMTDTTRNYVNMTDGYLYIYNGSEFEKTGVKYQEVGLSDKQIENRHLSDDVRISPNSLIYIDKNLIDIEYLNHPKKFITWFNETSTTIVEDTLNKINGFNTINIRSNSSQTHWNTGIEIPYTKQGKLTFSYLRKASVLNRQIVNAVDSNEKWYGAGGEVIKNYYKGWDLVKYQITIDTDITHIKFYIGNSGENNYNVGLFSLVEGDYDDILPKWGIEDLDEDLKLLINKANEDRDFSIENLGGLIPVSYSLNPVKFISWNNTNSSTISNGEPIINDYLSLNVSTNLSGGVHYLNSINIDNPTQSRYTFSCLIKKVNGSSPFINAVDNNNKYYKSNDGSNGDITSITDNYFGDYSLIKFSFNVNTDITRLQILVGYSGVSRFEIGMFSLNSNDVALKIVNNKIVTYDKLDDHLKSVIDAVDTTTHANVLGYDMLLPSKLFMIDEEPLRLYKKNIVVSANDIRKLELSVTSYSDTDFWNGSKQPYIEYINDKLELDSSKIMGNKVKFNLVGNDLSTRLTKEVEVVNISKENVADKTVVVNMFGDSTTHGGLNYSVSKLLDQYVASKKMIGTKTVNGVATEARSGWLYQHYTGYRTTYSTNDLPISESDYPNFLKVATDDDKLNKGDWCYTRTGSHREKTYNEIVAEGGNTNQDFYIFDYAYYLSINSFERPDFVTLGMGINDYWKYPDDATKLCEKALKIIVSQIHEASPNTIIILQPFPTKASNEVQIEWFKKCLELETYFRDEIGVEIEVVAEHLSQNKDLFFPATESEMNDKIANKEVISDVIHTTLAGYSEGARPIVYCMLNKIGTIG